MNQNQIRLIKDSFSEVEPILDYAVKLFYQRLFELDPGLRARFKSDTTLQEGKFLEVLTIIVNKLDRLDDILPTVEELGVRHVDYGIQPEYYNTAGEALMWTLEQGLDHAFTPEVREAWATAYSILANTMIAASEKAA